MQIEKGYNRIPRIKTAVNMDTAVSHITLPPAETEPESDEEGWWESQLVL